MAQHYKVGEFYFGEENPIRDRSIQFHHNQLEKALVSIFKRFKFAKDRRYLGSRSYTKGDNFVMRKPFFKVSDDVDGFQVFYVGVYTISKKTFGWADLGFEVHWDGKDFAKVYLAI